MELNSIKLTGKTLGFLLLTATTPSMAASIVTNGGFEDPHYGAGWVSDWFIIQADLRPLGPYEGINYAGSGCINFCPLYQDLPTQAGAKYDLSFAFNPGQQAGPVGAPLQNVNEAFRVYWDGNLLTEIRGGDMGWTKYSFNNLVGAAGGPTRLEFSAFDGYDSENGLDAVAVNLVSAVPEPATWAMMIVGFGAVGFMLRASRNRNEALPGMTIS